MRSIPIEENNYYHIFNRGNQKQQLFFDERDYVRMLFLILYSQSPLMFSNIERQVNYFLKDGRFKVDKDVVEEINAQRYVELINFCPMPNHFHLTLFNKKQSGISLYMHRILSAFSKYFNTKHNLSGHVFQGAYKAVQVTDDNQLTYLSSYIHKNSGELSKWKNNEHKYPWSSFCDYKENRWGLLLKPEIILERFQNFESYKQFVKESIAKEKLENSPKYFTY